MKNKNFEDEEKTINKKQEKREKKKRKSMKISGSQVKNLQKIIKNKNK